MTLKALYNSKPEYYEDFPFVPGETFPSEIRSRHHDSLPEQQRSGKDLNGGE
jgi:hypothetical protein